MNQRTRSLHDLGQRLWLDTISRPLLRTGTLQRYISEFDITGLTSNPSIFELALDGDAYDQSIEMLSRAGLSGEALFFELAMEDLSEAADLFRPIFDASDGLDGWVSLEVSPLLADEGARTLQAASALFERAGKPNLMIKIPGTPACLSAIEEVTFRGVPVNVTLLFSRAQYLAAADAHMRGIERRLAAGLDPGIVSVASMFVSRWDVAVKQTLPSAFQNRLGIAMARLCYRAQQELLATQRWQKLAGAGARLQRLLWASTGTKDPDALDTMYVTALAAPDTVDTLPEKTLLAFADHGELGEPMPHDGGDAQRVLEEFRRQSIDDLALAAKLQRDGVASFAAAWQIMLSRLQQKTMSLQSSRSAR
jgi:transaldolase